MERLRASPRHKHQDVSSISRTHIKMSEMAVRVSNLSAEDLPRQVHGNP